MDAAAPTTSASIVVLLPAETVSRPHEHRNDAFWPVAVVLLLILLTAATPAPATEMLLPLC